jgi:uncharacterized protein YjbI with pentapeptide repeats
MSGVFVARDVHVDAVKSGLDSIKKLRNSLGDERIDLRGADLRNLDLRSAPLEDAQMNGCNLCGTKLDHADLTKASIDDASFDRATLRSARLASATLSNASLKAPTYQIVIAQEPILRTRICATSWSTRRLLSSRPTYRGRTLTRAC